MPYRDYHTCNLYNICFIKQLIKIFYLKVMALNTFFFLNYLTVVGFGSCWRCIKV